jgi:hypothetical protein
VKLKAEATMKTHHSAYSSERATRLTIFIAYLTFGALHELTHLLVASWLLPVQATSLAEGSPFTTVSNIPKVLTRILLGRCVTIPLSSTATTTTTTDMDDTAVAASSLIRHSGWIISVIIAILCHFLYKRQQQQQQKLRQELRVSLSPSVVLAAYITAMEGISTDLLGWTPHHDSLWYTTTNNNSSSSSSTYLTFFCGNFGILLLNPSWLSVDGGRTALDVLEKMVSLV